MRKIGTAELLLKVFVTTTIFSLSYLFLATRLNLPFVLTFCLLGIVVLVPIELGIILKASKKEFGKYSLKSAFVNQEKVAVGQTVLIAFAFFSLAGLLSVSVLPTENQWFSVLRNNLLNKLPFGFNWTDIEYIKSFPRAIIILTCVFYSIVNGLLAPITEELFFRGYLTSHYKRQNSFTPVFIAILFSLYHFWLPFNNLFRILAFAPVAYVAYTKKNIYISICFHCFCNIFSGVGFVLSVL